MDNSKYVKTCNVIAMIYIEKPMLYLAIIGRVDKTA